MDSVAVMITTVGSEEQGSKIAEALVERQLAACVNIIKRVRSIYRWKGELWDDEEFILLIKTRESLVAEVQESVKKLHSYELPEVLSLPVSVMDERVKSWIFESTVQKADQPAE